MSEHEEVYLGGHRNKYNYSYALYYGPQDPRNMSQRCNPIVIDNDGAELEAVVHYLEALSSQPKRDRTHPYIVKMSSVKTLNWILIYIPACRTYGWVHPETGERVVYEPILRYLDALLLYLRSDGTALIFAFVPPRAVLPAVDQLAKTATKIVLREWEALCYNTCVRTVHALTGPGYSASPQQIKEAFDAMTHAQTRMSVGEQRAGKKANLGSSEKPKGPGRMQQAPGPSTASHTSPRQQPKISIDTHRVNIPDAPRSLDAPIRSSKKWMELIKGGDGHMGASARVFAELCEDVVPNFAQSKVQWPWITAGMRSGIEERLFLLQESWENLHAPSTGQKRAHSSSSNGSPAKKQKTSAWSRQTDSIDFSEHSKFLDEFTFTITGITRRLRNQILGKAEPLRFIVVFRNDYEDRKKYAAIDHLPHLIAAANQAQGSKKKIKLVTFPKSFERRFSEILDRRGQFEQCDFALEKKTYAHDEELIKLLKTVPALKPDSVA